VSEGEKIGPAIENWIGGAFQTSQKHRLSIDPVRLEEAFVAVTTSAGRTGSRKFRHIDLRVML
jgi:hypothetical protein